MNTRLNNTVIKLGRHEPNKVKEYYENVTGLKYNQLQIVEKMISALNNRGGFDDWWHNIDEEIQTEITNHQRRTNLFRFSREGDDRNY